MGGLRIVHLILDAGDFGLETEDCGLPVRP